MTLHGDTITTMTYDGYTAMVPPGGSIGILWALARSTWGREVSGAAIMHTLHMACTSAGKPSPVSLFQTFRTCRHSFQKLGDDRPRRDLTISFRRRFSKKSGFSARIGGGFLWAATP